MNKAPDESLRVSTLETISFCRDRSETLIVTNYPGKYRILAKDLLKCSGYLILEYIKRGIYRSKP